MKKWWMGWIAATALCVNGFGQAELTGTPAELAEMLPKVPRSVFVEGEGEVKAQADRASLRLRVTTTGKGLEQALQANRQARAKLVEFLNAHGITAAQVKAARFSSTPKYGMLSEKARSYRVDHSLKVTVQNEDQFQAVARAVDTMAAVEYLGADPEHSDESGLKAQAIGRACEDAGKRAKVFEERLGLKLAARGFGEPGAAPKATGQDRQAGRGLAPSFVSQAGSESDPSFKFVVRALTEEDGEAGFGELTYQARVKVEYLAEPR